MRTGLRESWNPQFSAPFSGPGIDVKEGEYLLEVNGRALQAADDVYAHLEGTAGKRMKVSLHRIRRQLTYNR